MVFDLPRGELRSRHFPDGKFGMSRKITRRNDIERMPAHLAEAGAIRLDLHSCADGAGGVGVAPVFCHDGFQRRQFYGHFSAFDFRRRLAVALVLRRFDDIVLERCHRFVFFRPNVG